MAKKALKTPTRPPAALTTYYVRGFPRELVREINAAAMLCNLPIGSMLAELVREALLRRRKA
jgi:hypothetical protein